MMNEKEKNGFRDRPGNGIRDGSFARFGVANSAVVAEFYNNCYIAPISTLKEVAQKTLVNVFRTFQVQRRAWFFTVKKPFEPTNDRRRLRNDGKAMVEDGGETG